MNGLQFTYQYGIGGAFFLLTLWVCTRAPAPRPSSDAFTVRVALGGIVAYAVVHAAWILVTAA